MSEFEHIPDHLDEEMFAWIRQHPEVWGEAVDEITPDEIDRLVASIVTGERQREREARHRRRRRRQIVGAAGALVVLGGGAVAAANLLGSGQPTQPNLGVACRAEADPGADAVVIDAIEDPVGGCAEEWATGEFRGRSASGVPQLVACVSSVGVVEVYPGADDLCDQLGYVRADPELSPDNEAIVALTDRIAEEINLRPCAPTSDIVARAEEILADSGLSGWSVSVMPEWAGSTCANVAVDAAAHTLFINENPIGASNSPP